MKDLVNPTKKSIFSVQQEPGSDTIAPIPFERPFLKDTEASTLDTLGVVKDAIEKIPYKILQTKITFFCQKYFIVKYLKHLY